MNIILSVLDRPIVANVCNQMLREVEQTPAWSMAHVMMNPGAFSLRHSHKRTDEVYIITRGTGELTLYCQTYHVKAGNVVCIPANARHQLFNSGATSLEHLVLARPPFNPDDVEIISDENRLYPKPTTLRLPRVEECFDGAQIMSYEFLEHHLSFAFGWVTNEPHRHKPSHYHKKTTEYIYVVEGAGQIDLNGDGVPITAGDWVAVQPNVRHALRNTSEQAMVVMCMCTPCFSMADVYH